MGLLLSIVAFVLSWLAGRRSVGAGMVVLLSVGYSYGLVRAVVFDGFSHLIFDAATLGLYAARFDHAVSLSRVSEMRSIYQCVAFLMGWPFIALLIGMAFSVHPLLQ